MQTNTKRRATPSEVSKQIVRLKQYHQQGCESIASKASHVKQAKTLGWAITKLDKARWFAQEYSEEALEALFASLQEHRPDFGVTHVGLLVTLRGHDQSARDELQVKCITDNWSTEDLQHQIEMRVGSRNSRGGRRPHVTAEATTIQVAKKANSLVRFINELKKSGIAVSKKMGRQLQQTLKEAGLLKALAAAELKKHHDGK